MKEFCALFVSDLIALSKYTFVQSIFVVVRFWAAPVSVTTEASNDLGFVSHCLLVMSGPVRHLWAEGRLEVK